MATNRDKRKGSVASAATEGRSTAGSAAGASCDLGCTEPGVFSALRPGRAAPISTPGYCAGSASTISRLQSRTRFTGEPRRIDAPRPLGAGARTRPSPQRLPPPRGPDFVDPRACARSEPLARGPSQGLRALIYGAARRCACSARRRGPRRASPRYLAPSSAVHPTNAATQPRKGLAGGDRGLCSLARPAFAAS